MKHRVLTALLALALSFAGGASARPSHNWSGLVNHCYRGDSGQPYAIGSYCTSPRGLVEVCVAGGWMNMGQCLGYECSVTCPS